MKEKERMILEEIERKSSLRERMEIENGTERKNKQILKKERNITQRKKC